MDRIAVRMKLEVTIIGIIIISGILADSWYNRNAGISLDKTLGANTVCAFFGSIKFLSDICVGFQNTFNLSILALIGLILGVTMFVIGFLIDNPIVRKIDKILSKAQKKSKNAEKEDNDNSYCPKCGSKLIQDSYFCSRCGYNLNREIDNKKE